MNWLQASSFFSKNIPLASSGFAIVELDSVFNTLGEVIVVLVHLRRISIVIRIVLQWKGIRDSSLCKEAIVSLMGTIAENNLHIVTQVSHWPLGLSPKRNSFTEFYGNKIREICDAFVSVLSSLLFIERCSQIIVSI